MSDPLQLIGLGTLATYVIVSGVVMRRQARRAGRARRDADEHRARCEEAYALLERTRAAAEEAIRAKSLFLANMSHELRSPLYAIIEYSGMAADVLEGDQEAAELRQDLVRIGGAGRQLLGVIDGVLDLARAEAGRMRLVVESFDVAAALREIAEAALPLAAANENTLDLRGDESLGVMRSDPAKLRQVLLHLLSNAAQHTVHGRIVLEASRDSDGRTLAFVVRDEGAGMTAEQQVRLFEPFTVAAAEPAPQRGRVGLGLALSKRYCALMGGDITVQSSPGAGSSFTVRLPAIVPEFTASGVFIAPPAAPRLAVLAQ